MTSTQISSEGNYWVEKDLRHGIFGAVSKIQIKETKEIFALKQLDLTNYDDQICEELLKEANTEFFILQKGLKNVVRSIGSHYNDIERVFKFSMEYYPENLKQMINERLEDGKGNMLFEEYLPYFQNIVEGMLEEGFGKKEN